MKTAALLSLDSKILYFQIPLQSLKGLILKIEIPPLEILRRQNFVKFQLARAAILRATCTTASKLALLAHKPRAPNSVNLDYFFALITYGTDLITPLENSVLVSAYTASSSAFGTSVSLTCTSLS